MSEFSHTNEDGEQEWDIPVVEVYLPNGNVLYFSWLNALLRTFAEPDDIYDHVEYTDENGVKQATPISEEIYEEMWEKDFPTFFLPVVDSKTQEWYEKHHTKNLEQELKDFFDGNTP